MLFAGLFVIFLSITNVFSAMTEKQMNATKKLVRNTCQNKSKASSAEVDGMQKGNFGTSDTANCYLSCIMNTYKLFKSDNTFDWEAGIKTIRTNAPESIATSASITLKNCKDAIKTPDNPCTAAMEVAKCIYDDNPQNYFIP